MADGATVTEVERIPGEPLHLEAWVVDDAVPRITAFEPETVRPLEQWVVQDIRPAEVRQFEHALNLALERADDHLVMNLRVPESVGNAMRSGDIILGSASRLPNHGLLDRVFRRSTVDFVPDAETQLSVDMPVLRLHCPHFEGCSTRFERKRKRKSPVQMKVKLPGIGGGAGVGLTLTAVEGLSAQGECLEQVQEAQVTLSWGTTYHDGRPFSYGFRISIDAIDSGVRVRRIPAESDPCGMTLDSLPEGLRRVEHLSLRSFYDLRGLKTKSGALKPTVEMARESSFNVELGPKVNILGIEAELTMQVQQQIEEALLLAFELAPGQRYYPFLRSPSSFEVCWTAET